MVVQIAKPGAITIVDQIERMDAARLRAYRDNLAFYRGEQWLGQARRRE